MDSTKARESKIEHFQSEKFQLLDGLRNSGFFSAIEDFHISKLFVSDPQDTHFPGFGQDAFDTLNMHIGILRTGTMAQIDRKLKHCKAILQELLPKEGILLPRPLGVGRQIEQYQHPHNPIFAKSGHYPSLIH